MKFTIAIVFAMVPLTSAQIVSVEKMATTVFATYCGARTAASYDQMQALNYGRFDSEIIDDRAKCFTNCFLETVGFLNDFEVQPERVNQILAPIVGEEAVVSAQAQCNSTQKVVDKCENAFLLYTCYYKAYGPLPGKGLEKPKTLFVVINEIGDFENCLSYQTFQGFARTIYEELKLVICSKTLD